MTEEKKKKVDKVLPPRAQLLPCGSLTENPFKLTDGKTPRSYDALPRTVRFVFMPPAHYVTGYRILDVYKTEVDLSGFRKFLFLEDPKQESKWGLLKRRMPYPESRVTDLPGTRDLHYKNYRLRCLTPESAMSWRKSISKEYQQMECIEEEEPESKCVC